MDAREIIIFFAFFTSIHRYFTKYSKRSRVHYGNGRLIPVQQELSFTAIITTFAIHVGAGFP